MYHSHESGDKAEGPLFRCKQCSKSYKRPEHLQRHAATHRPTRDYQCGRCCATFQRSDVLCRHAKICSGTTFKRPSTVRRACDACIKGKRRCSSNPPCLHCRKRGLVCSFTAAAIRESGKDQSRPVNDESMDDLSLATWPSADVDDPASALEIMDDEAWSNFLSTNLPDIIADDFDWTMLSAGLEKEEQPLRFLESFTRNTGFVHSFDCLTPHERNLAYTTFKSRPTVTEILGNELLLKSHELVTLVRETVEVKPRNNPVALNWSPVLEEMCLDFFSPQKLRLWLELYWAIWHPNVNFMHRPTFDVRSAKSSLVATMCIIGALVSPCHSDQESGRLWMNSVEEMVFRDDDVCYDGGRSRSFPTAGRLQALQAMYMVRRPLYCMPSCS